MNDKKVFLVSVIGILLVLTLGVLGTIGYYNHKMKKDTPKNENDNTQEIEDNTNEENNNKEDEENKEPEIINIEPIEDDSISEVGYDVYYNKYLKNLSNNLKKGLAKYDEYVYIYDDSSSYNSGWSFKLNKSLNLYITYDQRDYKDYLIDTDIVKMWASNQGQTGYNTLFYVKSSGELYSFNFDVGGSDKPEKEKSYYVTNVFKIVQEKSFLSYETICGLGDCSNLKIASNLSKTELYKKVLLNYQKNLRDFLNKYYYEDPEYSWLSAYVTGMNNYVYFSIDHNLELFLHNRDENGKNLENKLDTEVLKGFSFETAEGNTLYYIKTDGSVYRYNFDKNYADYDKEPVKLSNLKNIINVVQIGGEKRYELFEDIEGNLFYSDGKAFI